MYNCEVGFGCRFMQDLVVISRGVHVIISLLRQENSELKKWYKNISVEEMANIETVKG